MGRARSTKGVKQNACRILRILVGKPEGKVLLGRASVGGWIIIKWILYRMGWYGLG
jgi:hypothetical protein